MNKNVQGYKVLVVDDEPHVLEGLKTMIDWEELECSKLYFSESSEEAKKTLYSHKIDILITDIRLPGENGLDMIESLKKQDRDLKIVVMSGYRDFEYVKRAMTLGVDGYLIKPVFQEDAFEVLKPIIQALNHHNRIQTYSEESALFMVKDYLIHHTSLDDQKADLLGYIKDKGYYLLGAWHGEKDYMCQQVQEIIYSDGSNPLGIILYKDDYGVICFAKSEFRPFWMDLQLGLKHEIIWQEAEIGNSFEQMSMCFYQYNQKLPILCRYMKGNGILDRRIPDQDAYIEDEKALRSLFKKDITEEKRDLLDKHIENFFFLLTRSGLDFEGIKKRFMDFYYRLINEMDYILQGNEQSEEIHGIPQILNNATLETLCSFFENRILEIMEISKIQRNRCKEDLVCQVEELMRENLSNNMTLTELAKKVHLHPAYLGQKLSDYWGESYKRRLNRMRIERAIKLLLSDTDSVGIEACAYQVGFKNYMTFLKYFKLFYHTTPRKYIEKYKN